VAGDEYSIAHQRDDAGAARVLLAGEFDLNSVAALSDALAEPLADATVDHVLVDMSETTFIDSSGLRALVLAYEAALDAGKRFALVDPQRGVRRLFEIVGLTQMLDDG
jgi:anti-sigma B factor antagonist